MGSFLTTMSLPLQDHYSNLPRETFLSLSPMPAGHSEDEGLCILHCLQQVTVSPSPQRGQGWYPSAFPSWHVLWERMCLVLKTSTIHFGLEALIARKKRLFALPRDVHRSHIHTSILIDPQDLYLAHQSPGCISSWEERPLRSWSSNHLISNHVRCQWYVRGCPHTRFRPWQIQPTSSMTKKMPRGD